LLNQRLGEDVASLLTLAEHRRTCCLFLEAFTQLRNRIELARQLGEFVVCFGKLSLLHRGERELNLGFLPLVLTTEQLRREGRGLSCGQGLDCLVSSLEQVAGAHFVRYAGSLIDLFAVDAS